MAAKKKAAAKKSPAKKRAAAEPMAPVAQEASTASTASATSATSATSEAASVVPDSGEREKPPSKKRAARAEPLPDRSSTLERAFSASVTSVSSSRSSRPPASKSSVPPPAISVTHIPDSPSMLSIAGILDDAQSIAAWKKRWAAVSALAATGKPAQGDEVAAVVAWGRSLGRISEDVLDDVLPNVVTGLQIGNALIALLRAGAVREVISVSKQLVDACVERQYDGEYATSFVSQVFAAATFVDGDIREEVLGWALDLRCAPDPTVYFNTACALALSGHADRALANVRLARKHGVPAHVFRNDSDFARITKHPDFARAIA